VTTELQVAAVSFVAAVVAVIVGQLLGGLVERRTEEQRTQRAELERRHARGVQAAEAVLDAIIELDLGPFSTWKVMEKRTQATDPWRPAPTQAELEPYVQRIERHGLAIEDKNARQTAHLAGIAVYGYEMIGDVTGLKSTAVWWTIKTEAQDLLGAYIRDETVREPAELTAYNRELADWYTPRDGDTELSSVSD
jgi:hypothetical protein